MNGEFLFGEVEKEKLCRIAQQLADGLGVDLDTFQAMSNHFHTCLRVPKKVPISDAELIRRWHVLYPKPSRFERMQLERIEQQLSLDGPLATAWRERMLAMMGDVSQYMKMLKQRYTTWFNRTHDRYGTLWCERFGSTLVELDGPAYRALAVYIDLNCVRAAIVTDPKDYRFGGYGQAVAGNEAARRGLMRVMGGTSWDEVQREYRVLLFTVGSQSQEKGASIPESDLQRVLRQGGRLPLGAVLRCRVRYFSRGAVLGSNAFVDGQLLRLRARLGPRTRVHPLPDLAGWTGLAVLRSGRGPALAPPIPN
ncbi:MAG TPA: transposase [Opitutaceae bacterium]|nr:transposase [Opitutaceae bacterium]